MRGAAWVQMTWSVVWCVLAGAPAARAQPVQELARRLTPYDTGGERTFEVLDDLTDRAQQAASPADRAELSFLHVMASTDLWMIAQVTENDALEQRLAEHFGVEVQALPAVFQEALVALPEGLPEGPIEDALTALRILAGPATKPLPDTPGTRGSLAFLQRAFSRGPVEAPLELAELAALSADPCPRLDVCEAPFWAFDAEGRAAVASLRRVVDALARLQEVRAHDPLVAALDSTVRERAAALENARLKPVPRVSEGPRCPAPAFCGEPGHPDVVALVQGGQVRVGFVPIVRIDGAQGLQLEALGEPVWPETRVVAIPESLPPYLRGIREVKSALEEMRGEREGLQLALGTDGQTQAHLWARVLLSARAAGFDKPLALGRTDEGSARVQAMRVVPAWAAERLSRSELDVTMGFKGYSVRRWGPSTLVERQPGPDGSPQFDVPTLLSRAKPKGVRSSYLRFMPQLAADDLLSTTFAVAPEGAKVTLILP